MRIDLTDEERGALVCALTMVPEFRLTPLQPHPDDTDHDQRLRRITYSAMLKIIGRHPEQLATAGDYSI